MPFILLYLLHLLFHFSPHLKNVLENDLFNLFNPHARICLLILEREEGVGGGEKETMWERNIDCALPYVPQAGIEPAS